MTVFLATLGQRPEAITMALDALLPRYHYTEVMILHTDAELSGISEACAVLMRILSADYGDIIVRDKTLYHENGLPLIDIKDQFSAEVYHRALLDIIRQYRAEYIPIHLLVAGGRKAMSIYAALAAVLLFGEYDYLWTIHTPPKLMQTGVFHAPMGTKEQVQVIQLPVSPSRLLPGMIIGESIPHLLERTHKNPRQRFLQSLTAEESKLTDMLSQHPYASNDLLGEMLTKSPKTIDNQLRSIYGKLLICFDLNIEDKRKRQALLDVLAGRV